MKLGQWTNPKKPKFGNRIHHEGHEEKVLPKKLRLFWNSPGG